MAGLTKEQVRREELEWLKGAMRVFAVCAIVYCVFNVGHFAVRRWQSHFVLPDVIADSAAAGEVTQLLDRVTASRGFTQTHAELIPLDVRRETEPRFRRLTSRSSPRCQFFRLRFTHYELVYSSKPKTEVANDVIAVDLESGQLWCFENPTDQLIAEFMAAFQIEVHEEVDAVDVFKLWAELGHHAFSRPSVKQPHAQEWQVTTESDQLRIKLNEQQRIVAIEHEAIPKTTGF